MKTKSSADRGIRDIYGDVTAKIVASMEAGTAPWAQPWRPGMSATRRPLRNSGEPYRGVNVLLLWTSAQEQGFASNRWMTYAQAEAVGAHVRKGERGCMVVYANRVKNEAATSNGDELAAEKLAGTSVAFLRTYMVFNLDQLRGLSVDTVSHDQAGLSPGVKQDGRLSELVAGTGAIIRHGGERALYSPEDDRVQMPAATLFRDSASYAATLLHELAHWTGHPSRLAREFGRRFGDQAYAVEELVAELCSAFVCADLGLVAEPREDHAAYVSHWLQVLKADKRAIFNFAAHAQRAADFLHPPQGSDHV